MTEEDTSMYESLDALVAHATRCIDPTCELEEVPTDILVAEVAMMIGSHGQKWGGREVAAVRLADEFCASPLFAALAGAAESEVTDETGHGYYTNAMITIGNWRSYI